MGFRLKNEARTDIDFGETSIENMFIKHFLPFADEDQIKVYILGLFYAKSNSRADIAGMARELDISEERVMRALEYWEKNDLLTIEKLEEGFGVAFFSVRSQVFSGNRNAEQLGLQSKQFAEALIGIIGKPLSSAEYAFYEKFVLDMGGDLEILKTVLTLYYKDFKGNDFSEVSRFLEHVLKSQSRDFEQITIAANNYFSRNSLYKRIKIMIGGRATTTPAEQAKINSWMDVYGMKESEIIKFVEEHSPSTNNPTIGFIDKLIVSLQTIAPERKKRLELLKKLKLEITGSRYAVNKKEQQMMEAWFDELHMSEEEVGAAIARFSATNRGATVGFIDECIRGNQNRTETSGKSKLKIRNKKDAVEEFVDEELMQWINHKGDDTHHGDE